MSWLVRAKCVIYPMADLACAAVIFSKTVFASAISFADGATSFNMVLGMAGGIPVARGISVRHFGVDAADSASQS